MVLHTTRTHHNDVFVALLADVTHLFGCSASDMVTKIVTNFAITEIDNSDYDEEQPYFEQVFLHDSKVDIDKLTSIKHTKSKHKGK